MTPEEVKEKIKNNILNGSLTIKKTKTIVPMYGFSFVDDKTKTIVGLNAMINEAGIRKDKKLVDQLKTKRQDFIKNGTSLYESFYEVYFVLGDYLKLLNPEDLSMVEYELNLGEIFNKYISCYQYESVTYLKNRVKDFFKYMPYLQFLVEYYDMSDDELKQGFCCEDCEGDYNRYISSKYFYGTIDKIKEKLKQIKLI